ncbi:MAG: alpha/beta family hydrolase [Hyphomicrobiaceae bacterium]
MHKTVPELRIDRAKSARAMLILAHGAGAPMDSPFMETMVTLLVERNINVARFEFSYMAKRRIDQKRRPAPKADTLISAYASALMVAASDGPLFIGGKSMGGRIATMLADDAYSKRQIRGAICLGYPFHPPNKPEQTRTGHLSDLKAPLLIVQGERDPFGTATDVATYTLSPRVRFVWVPDGDHDLGPRGASGYTRKSNLAHAADAIAAFVAEFTD